MPLFSALSTTANVTPREFVWNHLRDVRDAVGTDLNEPDEREEIVITKGMLRRLLDNPSEYDPSAASSNDGTSYWTIFEGLLVFEAIDKTRDIEDLFVFDVNNPNNLKLGLGSEVHNLKYTKNGQRGNSTGLYGTTQDPERGITDLFVEVKYYDEADVDVDYVVLQTPNARALLREQFRDSLSSSIGRTIDEFSAAASGANASMNYKLLGLRSPEEAGEWLWYSQRYLNILTSGAMISEIDMKPFDRYVHCVYPFSNWTGSYPDNPLPLWTWNEGSTGRTNPLTPVPFIKNGGQAASEYYTMGYKSGVCGGAYSNNGVYTVGSIGICQASNAQERTLLSHDFDLGWHCQNSAIGSDDGWFSFFKDAPERLWRDPRFYEVVNTDHNPASPSTDPNTFPSDGDCSFDDGAKESLRDPNNWTSTQLVSTNLYSNFIADGNQEFLFDGHQWLEQVWLGTGKTIVSAENKNDPNELMHIQVSTWNQSRPMTGEEIRFRLMSPTLLGAEGVMLFSGNYYSKDNEGNQLMGKYQGSYQVLFNMQNIIDHKTAASFNDVSQHARSVGYGKDYPTYAGTEKTQDFQLNIGNNNPDVKTYGYLENHYEGPNDANGNPTGIPLWYSKYAYTHTDGSSIGGLDIVQRVNPNGAIYGPNNDVERLYVGSMSGRLELLRYSDWLQKSLADFDDDGDKVLVNGQRTDDQSSAVVDEPESIRELLSLLDLHAWYAKGYKEHSVWKDMSTVYDNPISDWLDVNRILSRHPYREFNARADYEDDDSLFVDITLHKRRPNLTDEPYAPYNSEYVAGEVYIGVQNRRQNPLYLQDVSDPNSISDDIPRFSSTQEFLALVSKSENNHHLYDQLGSRSVVLPFDFEDPSGKPKLLHVEEVNVGTGSQNREDVLYSFVDNGTTRTVKRSMIDTIVDAKGVLEIDLLPGEGKLLRVRVIEATAEAAEGNLAFNTQTKLVVAPEQIFVNGVAQQSNKVRYHMVYMAPNEDDEWRVYYKRSTAYPRDNLPNVAGLEWPEAPIELGNETTVNRLIGPRQTINQTGLVQWYNGAYTPGISHGITDGADGVHTIAGFPSITIARHIVRQQYESASPDSVVTQKIHIAFAMSFKTGEDIGDQVHVVETILTDGNVPPNGPYPTKTLSIIRGGDFQPYPIDSLATWGTPTNGTSTFLYGNPNSMPATPGQYELPDRVFTAWSVATAKGITSTVRDAFIDGVNEQRFLCANELDVIPLSLFDKAQYPSLTPYSNATRDHWTSNASLVWQERRTDGGTDIMYTRCWEVSNVNPNLSNHNWGVPVAVTMHYGDVTPPAAQGLQVFYHGVNSTMRMSEDRAGDNNLYPTIVRSTTEPSGDPFIAQSIGTGAMVMTYSDLDPLVSGPDPRIINYEFEHVTWQALPLEQTKTRIKRRYFIMDPETIHPGPGDKMRYWWIGQTYNSSLNLVSPVIAAATNRRDVQRYSLTSAPGEWEYFGDYAELSIDGNVSDTASITTFAGINGDFTGNFPAGSIPWTTWGASATVDQYPLRYIPIPPHAQAVQTVHEESRTDGEWAHLSHRLWTVPEQKQSLRRIQSEGGDAVSPIISSAEYFYKPTHSNEPRWRTLGGFSTGQEEIALGGLVADGNELTFRQESSQEFSILGAAQFVDALHVPTQSLVTEAFSLDNELDIDIDVEGIMRNGMHLTVEEVDPTTGKALSKEASIDVGLPEASDRASKSQRKTTKYLFSKAESKYYRFRLSTDDEHVMFEQQIYESPLRAFGKSGLNSTSSSNQTVVVDVNKRSVQTLSESVRIIAYPTPTSEKISFVVHLHRPLAGSMWVSVVNTKGETAQTVNILDRGTSLSLDVQSLPSGVYFAQLSDEQGYIGGARFIVNH